MLRVNFNHHHHHHPD
ncbi:MULTISPECIES: his operon leader peptide [Dickeya]|uniref:his operon leader peptide n=5 Tax=Dickeya TaxID=204037 RepID=A0AAP1XID4_9GAMM|nr:MULTISPECIES: his operon leader peptide [Dickeya]MBI0436783.1 his operon leader peptide [Dickeya dianthicola]MBI0447530.1 his operon leader peptide [Dickeya dianthicola]MBI0452241.1 his operon leader peptide [Dickeya dianthicola]MBI0456498.1 his operon leader peptide [Dickeya dianthicola]MBI0460927.1 his operon leader peptide [Dickeya dianthicola]